jgi:hypothetical protein
MLVIDDEADHASVNTKDEPAAVVDEETDPSRINGLIRKLLHSFEQTAYVGYTATPFANIFMYAGEPSADYGEDLFPRSFIVRLPAPTNHFGPAEVFGVSGDASAGLEERAGLPITRTVDDHEDWIETGHKRHAVPGPLPESLREALRSFILTCAARRARGQVQVHNTMLIHVTRFVDVQERVSEQINEELRTLRERIRYGDGASPEQLMEELHSLWQADYVSTQEAFSADRDLESLSWEEVQEELVQAVGRIEVMTINGSARDALTYFDHPQGMSVIAIGGDKLSRGLTLEGLSVSYFLRASKMYDTLMQMGRWFGYRPGYIDLCRLYTTQELQGWYRDITGANEELLGLFDEMAAVGGTPENFGLRVRKHPDGLLITARTKLRNGREMRLSFSNTIIETIAFDPSESVQSANLDRVERFLRDETGRGGPPHQSQRNDSLWKDVAGEDVADLLASLSTSEEARKARGDLLASYIRARVAERELKSWTVALISSKTGSKGQVAGQDVGLIVRRALTETSTQDVYRIRRLGSPTDEMLDLSDEQIERARTRTGRIRKNNQPIGQTDTPVVDIPNGPSIRHERSPENGLLLLYPLDPAQAYEDIDGRARNFPDAFPPIMGFAVSFPESPEAPSIDYVVTNTYWQLELGIE